MAEYGQTLLSMPFNYGGLIGGPIRNIPFGGINNIPGPVAPPTPPPPVVTTPPPTPAPTMIPPVAQPLAPATGAQVTAEDIYVPSIKQVATGLDPLTEQLLFGIGGEGGFIPGAMRAAERTFFNPDGTPRVVEEKVAGFSPDQLAAQDLTRRSVGLQNPFIGGAARAFGRGIGALRSGVGGLRSGLGESADILRGTLGSYDPSMTSRFFNPFEDRVVQQTIDDVLEAGAKRDIAARAGNIARGGQSAFGSRARLGAGELQESLGRGLAEALSGIRSRGFSEAQQTGLSEFARQNQARRAAAAGLAGLTGQGFQGQQALQSGLFGLGSALQGLGAQAQGASAADIAQLYGMGTAQQQLSQAQLDAQRRNLLQAQQAPLAQYQALAPFVGMAPAGQFQTLTEFAPKPSATQIGIGTGLSTFGALGNLYGGG